MGSTVVQNQECGVSIARNARRGVLWSQIKSVGGAAQGGLRCALQWGCDIATTFLGGLCCALQWGCDIVTTLLGGVQRPGCQDLVGHLPKGLTVLARLFSVPFLIFDE